MAIDWSEVASPLERAKTRGVAQLEERRSPKCDLCGAQGQELRAFMGGGKWCANCATGHGWAVAEWRGLPLISLAK